MREAEKLFMGKSFAWVLLKALGFRKARFQVSFPKAFLKFLLISFAFIPVLPANADLIKVGGYPFPPFVEQINGEFVGITLDLIEVMNQFQTEHQFEFVPTSPRRRYEKFSNGDFDMIMFGDINWGWKKNDVVPVPSMVYFFGGEVYVTKNNGNKSQSYFDDFNNKSISVITGYHYGFAGYNSDPQFLRDNFDIELSPSFDGNIMKVHRDRTDLAVVTLSYLKKLTKERPGLEQSLLVSEKFDQRYNHTMLIRDSGINLSVDELNDMIIAMQQAGVLDALWEKYGILELKDLGEL